MVEYALFTMALVVGTAAAQKLVAERGANAVDTANVVLDEAGAAFAKGASGDGEGGAKKGGGGSGIDDGSTTTGIGGSDPAKAKRRDPRRQGSEPRAIVTFKDDARSAP
jgi:hypothetical protein